MRYIFLERAIAGLLTGLMLSACASKIPLAIKTAPPGDPSPQEVVARVADLEARPVRWGGTLLATENRENTTWLTVLAQPLSDDGKPKESDESPGRFIAIVPGFLDPEVYSRDRRITVAGTVLRTETRKVGDFAYPYPVIQAEATHLWPAGVEPYDDYWYPYPGYRWQYDPWLYHPYFFDHLHHY